MMVSIKKRLYLDSTYFVLHSVLTKISPLRAKHSHDQVSIFGGGLIDAFNHASMTQ